VVFPALLRFSAFFAPFLPGLEPLKVIPPFRSSRRGLKKFVRYQTTREELDEACWGS
jgi:hypothetical protein